MTEKLQQWGCDLRRRRESVKSYLYGKGRLWLWFVSALAGVSANHFFRLIASDQPNRISGSGMIIALVATLITFSTTFERYQKVKAQTPLLVQISYAFQCGFFWQAIFYDLTIV